MKPGRQWSPGVIITEFNFQFVIYIVCTQNIVARSRLRWSAMVYSKLSKLDDVCIKPGRPWSPWVIKIEFSFQFVIYTVCTQNIVACSRLRWPVVVYSKLSKLNGVCIKPGRLWSPWAISTKFIFQFMIYTVCTKNIVACSRLRWPVVVYSKLSKLDNVR